MLKKVLGAASEITCDKSKEKLSLKDSKDKSWSFKMKESRKIVQKKVREQTLD